MGNLYDLDNMCPAAANYALATELNKAQADITQLNTSGNLTKNKVHNSAGLAVGAGDLTMKLTTGITYTINGVMYIKAATDNIAMAGGTALQAASGTAIYAAYFVEVNATAAISLQKGADASSAAAAVAALTAVSIPSTVALVGVIHVQNSAGVFSPGSTTAGAGDWADDTTADTYVNFIGVTADDFDANYTQTFAAIT